MKKNLRIIQINGFRGLMIAFFVLSCLIAGFIAFPAFLAMSAWNYLAETTSSLPLLTFVGGLLLWAIIAFSFYIFSKKKFVVSIGAEQELSDMEVEEVVAKIKSQKIKHQNLLPKEFNNQTELKEEEQKLNLK